MGSLSTWKKVECGLFGPFPVVVDGCVVEHRWVMSLLDPFSQWTLAESTVQDSTDVFSALADFLLRQFCLFGFTPTSIVNHSQAIFDLASLLQHLQVRMETCGWSDLGLPASFLSHEPETTSSQSLATELAQFTGDFPTNWHLLLQSWLFRKRIAPMEGVDQLSPFAIVFQHEPINFEIKDKGQIVMVESRRRMIKNPNLQCRHCDEVFTSRVSFQIHQKYHLEAAKARGKVPGEKEADKPKATPDGESDESDDDDEDSSEEYEAAKDGNRFGRKRKGVFVRRIDPSARIAKLATSSLAQGIERDQADEVEVTEVAQNTLKAVRALLAATKTERKKRGKYTKFGLEMRDEIAQYALDHGIESACQEFTARLDYGIHASSVRNYIKIFQTFTSELRAEIGRFVYQYGFDRCLQEFGQTRPELNLNRSLMRQFKRLFVRNHPNLEDDNDDLENEIATMEGDTRPRRMFEPHIRDEIGQFAQFHGNAEAVKTYSTKLDLPIKEATVRKFKKAWIEKSTATQYEVVPNMAPNMAPNHVIAHNPVSMCSDHQQQQQVITVQMPTNVIQTAQMVNSDGTFVQYPVVLATSTGNFHTPVTQVQVLQNNQSSNVFSGVQQEMAKQHSQHVVLNDPNQMTYIAQSNQNGMPLQLTTTGVVETESYPHVQAGPMFPVETQSQEAEEVVNPPEEVAVQDENVAVVRPKKKTRVKGQRKISKKNLPPGKRGQYTTYDPKMRATIGKYASEHGNQDTINFFKRKHRLVLPESTVRGLRDRYLLQSQRKGEAKELTFGPRGRPMRLGKYDEIVKKCIYDLIDSGEKMSTFLAIATAKQVLQQNDPSMLIENGGKVNLNPVWAKSFLKRIGVSIRNKRNPVSTHT